ncbi:MAG: Ig-like domain-containing protein, partial [Oscillospiraceae bacterium]|nr:Ig-like domain-containing protein [Oscillospiraceae bacterium]
MKKFLSLLLTLTMVMSLVVLPARADEKVCSANPAEVSLAVGQTGNTQSVTINGATDSATYVWNSADPAIATVSDTGKTATITAVAAGTTSVTCQVSQAAVEAAKDGSSSAIPAINETVEISVTVTDPEQDAANAAFKAAINLTYGNHACGTDSGTIVGYRFTSTDAWNATLKENSGFEMTTNNFTPSNNEITIQGTRAEDSKSVTAKFKVSVTEVGVTVTAKPAKVATNQGTATLTATATAVPNAVITYAWKNGSSTLNGNTATIQLVKPSEQASITCTATYTFTDKSTKEVTSSATTVEVDNTTYEWTGLPTGTLNMSKGDTNTDTLSAIKLVASGTSNEPNDVAYSYVSSNPSAVTVIDNSNGGKAIKAVGSGYATITITAKDKTAKDANYRGVLYTTEVKVSSIALEYSLGSVSNGSAAQSYYQSSLESYAAQLIAQRTNRN